MLGSSPVGPTWGIWKQKKESWAQFATVSNITKIEKKKIKKILEGGGVYLGAIHVRKNLVVPFKLMSIWACKWYGTSCFLLLNCRNTLFLARLLHSIADIFFFVVYSCGCVVHIACVLALCVLTSAEALFSCVFINK